MTLRRDILVVVRPFMTHHLYCSQDCTQERTYAHIRRMLPLVVPAWETFQESYSVMLWVASRAKGKSNKGLGGMELNQSGMPSGLPLVHLHPASVVETGGTSKMPASVREGLSSTREGKFQWRVCLRPHLEQGRTLPVEKSHDCGYCFFLTDGS